jgi:NhaP-type Na+/H+ or K+/H+ antiporter
MLIDCWLLYELVIGYAVGLLAGWTIGQLIDSVYLFTFLEPNPVFDITG